MTTLRRSFAAGVVASVGLAAAATSATAATIPTAAAPTAAAPTAAAPTAVARHWLSHPVIRAHFDLAAGQTPENLTVEPNGDVDLSLALSRQIVRVTTDGHTRVLVTMPKPADGGVHTPAVGQPIVTGVTRSRNGTLYFLYAAGDGGLTGLWRLRPGGQPHRIAPLPATSLPNGLVLDQHAHTFYVSDSALATIYRVPLAGGAPAVWASGPQFAPTSFLGANGLKLHEGALWSSNTDQGTIMRTPFTPEGAAGTTRTRAQDLTNVDDFAFPGRGSQLVAALNGPNQVVLVRPDGTHTVVLDAADGLQNPSGVAIRHGVVYITDEGLNTGKDPNLLLAGL